MDHSDFTSFLLWYFRHEISNLVTIYMKGWKHGDIVCIQKKININKINILCAYLNISNCIELFIFMNSWHASKYDSNTCTS